MPIKDIYICMALEVPKERKGKIEGFLAKLSPKNFTRVKEVEKVDANEFGITTQDGNGAFLLTGVNHIHLMTKREVSQETLDNSNATLNEIITLMISGVEIKKVKIAGFLSATFEIEKKASEIFEKLIPKERVSGIQTKIGASIRGIKYQTDRKDIPTFMFDSSKEDKLRMICRGDFNEDFSVNFLKNRIEAFQNYLASIIDKVEKYED
ncbi:hypothetical protein ES703_00799 [subsurface metagenome]